MFKIAICDDENLFTEELKELISGYMIENDLIYEIDTYSSGEALVELGVGVVRYTVVFLDINMEKIDGIKTAEIIRKVSREVFIVFVTAYVDYSLEGYRLDVVRYLLKGNANFQSNVNECMDAIIEKMNYSVIKRKFDFKEGRKEIVLDRLLYIESNLHRLEFHVMEDDEIIPPVRFRLTSLTAGHFPTTEYIRCIIRRRNVFMKLEISIKFIDENGMEATKPVTVDTSVPDFDDFHDVNDFLLVFDQLEKAGLKLRNESFSTALAQYMETMSKKNCTDSKAPKRLPHT